MAAQGTHLGPADDGGPLTTSFSATAPDPRHLGTHLAPEDDATHLAGSPTFLPPDPRHFGVHLAPEDDGSYLTHHPLIFGDPLTGQGSLVLTKKGVTRSLRLFSRLTGAGSVSYVEPPPPNEMFGEGTLGTGTPVVGRAGGSTAAVSATGQGKGTKVLAGSTARVLVAAVGIGLRVPPYTPHPNTREDTNYAPSTSVALAAFPRDEEREPRSGEGRQLILLGAAPSTSESEDDSIFDVDHRG